MWRLIAPRIARRFWRDLLLSTAVGAASAGLFGVLHDQVTYTVSEEYFTKVKFVQFAYADPGTGPRAFAGVVGFLASWWVGAIAGWLLGRLAFPRLARREAWRRVAQGYGWVFGGALTGALAGAVIGHRVASSPALETWRRVQRELDIEQLDAFVRVACIHNGSYAGAFTGFVIAAVLIVRASRRTLVRP